MRVLLRGFWVAVAAFAALPGWVAAEAGAAANGAGVGAVVVVKTVTVVERVTVVEKGSAAEDAVGMLAIAHNWYALVVTVVLAVLTLLFGAIAVVGYRKIEDVKADLDRNVQKGIADARGDLEKWVRKEVREYLAEHEDALVFDLSRNAEKREASRQEEE